jgi:hypothetical protein
MVAAVSLSAVPAMRQCTFPSLLGSPGQNRFATASNQACLRHDDSNRQIRRQEQYFESQMQNASREQQMNPLPAR